eukprot:gene13675-18401_t
MDLLVSPPPVRHGYEVGPPGWRNTNWRNTNWHNTNWRNTNGATAGGATSQNRR